MVDPQDFIKPNWPAPQGIHAFSTCRSGGGSAKPYDSLNLAFHVGDAERQIDKNRQLLIEQCQGLQKIQWLNQRHGIDVVEVGAQALPDADACITSRVGEACAVMTADCLPLLFCDRAGQQVAAAHAGWRGLLAGVLEQTVKQFSCQPEQLLVWFGPAISQACFEVGEDVRQAFMHAAAGSQLVATELAFKPSDQPQHYLADLYQLARLRLLQLGVSAIYGGDFCTYTDAQRFFSYRREGVTGRMATLIYKAL